MTAILVSWLVALGGLNQAQAQEAAGPASYQGQIFYAPLVSSADDVDATIPLGGLRFSEAIGKNYLELTVATGAGHGMSYQIVAGDFRAGMDLMGFYVFGTLGVNFDFYSPNPNSGETSRRVGNGFHFAGGFIIPLGSTLLFRTDFQQRFGPGRSLWIMVGPVFEF